MPIYAALKNSGTTIAAFKERQVADLMPGAVGDVPVVGYSTGNNIAFGFIIQKIHKCVKAQQETSSVFGSPEVYNAFKPTEVTQYFERPMGSFLFPNLSEEGREVLRGLGFIQEPGRNQVWQGSPDATGLSSVFQLEPSEGRTSPGTVSSDGYLSYIYALKGMNIYSYASHVGISGRSTILLKAINMVNTVEKPDDKIKVYNSTGSTSYEDAVRSLGIPEEANALLTFTDGELLISRYDRSKRLPNFTVTTQTEISFSGHFFPYFSGMVLPDKDYTSHVFGRLFVHSMGATVESSRRMLQRIRSGFRNLAFSRAGMAISHAYLGIELSQMMQCPISFVIENNVYHGFVLKTEDDVYHFSKKHEARNATVLQGELRSINMHRMALAGILSIINAPVRADGNQYYNYRLPEIDTSRKLANVLRDLNQDLFTSTSWKTDIVDLFDKLAFGDSFASTNQNSLLAFLSFVETGEYQTLAEYPSVISRRILEEQDRVSFGLAIFGPTVPSLNYGDPKRGRTFTVPGEMANDGNLIPGTDGKKPLQFLPIGTAPYSQGLAQWRSLFQNSKFVIPNGRGKKAEFTDTRQIAFRISNDPAFTRAYGSIKRICQARRDTGGRKRKQNVADDDEKDSVKKQRKAIGEDAMEI